MRVDARNEVTVERLAWVCFGSGVGGGARYLLSGWIQRALGAGFPYGTLAVNAIGSFVLAALMYAATHTSLSPNARLALTTGAMGGFTTYSTFSYETLRYVQDGAWAVAAANIAGTVVGCLAASMAGWAVARWLLGG